MPVFNKPFGYIPSAQPIVLFVRAILFSNFWRSLWTWPPWVICAQALNHKLNKWAVYECCKYFFLRKFIRSKSPLLSALIVHFVFFAPVALRPNVNAPGENGTFRIFFANLYTLCTFCGKFPISVVKSYVVEKYTIFPLMEQHAKGEEEKDTKWRRIRRIWWM